MFIKLKASDSQKPKQCFLTRCIPVITMLTPRTTEREWSYLNVHRRMKWHSPWYIHPSPCPFTDCSVPVRVPFPDGRAGGRPWPVRSRRHSGWRQARTESRASIVGSPHPRRSNSSILLTGAPHLDRAVKRSSLRNTTWPKREMGKLGGSTTTTVLKSRVGYTCSSKQL